MLGASRQLPRTVWALGFVSLFMDFSTEMIQSLLPVFLVSTLGASTATVGLIEGIGEATASITKLFSGWLSDRLGRRKLLAVLGYGLSAVSKPLFPLATGPLLVLGARFSDRVGKGLRGAPRDALVADVAGEGVRGAAFGLRQALDTVGAILGPLAAIVLMWAFRDDIRGVFAVAIVPAVISVILLMAAVREPRQVARREARARPGFRWSEVRTLGAPFWMAVGIGVAFALARFSEAFLVLRGAGLGLPLVMAPVVLIVMNLIYAATSAPFGALSDRLGRKPLLAVGMAVLIAADVVLASARGAPVALAGVALWGLHMGLTQGLLSALVADTAPADLRGSAFGLFNFATGVATFAASALAGALWAGGGPAVAFLAGAAFAAVALAMLLASTRAIRPA